MKTFLILLFSLLLTCSGISADLKLAWDDAQPGVTYRIEIAPLVAVTATPAWTIAKDNIPKRAIAPGDTKPVDYQETTITGISPGIYMLRAFARGGGLDSEPSEILRDAKALPSAPGKPRVAVRLQSSTDLKEWHTIAAVTEDAEQKKFYRTILEIEG